MNHGARCTKQITDEDLRAVRDAARAHERSVLRRVVGLPVRGRVAADIDRELVRRGLKDAPVSTDATSEPPSSAA